MSSWPGTPPSTRLAPLTAIALSVVLLATAAFYFAQDWRRILDLSPVTLQVRANLPENGGWQAEPLRVASGRTVRLRVASMAGTHSFALAHTDVRSSRPLRPGEEETVQFMAPEPGRYVLYCTTWCSPDHWRMRTVLEVFDPAHPEAPLAYPQETPRYQIAMEDLPLDVVHQPEVHPAAMGPDVRPNATAGATLWQQLGPTQTPMVLLINLGWPAVSPREVYEQLGQGYVRGLETGAGFSDAERWSLVAYLWQQGSTTESLARGAALFQENCADCHGETGRGDGLAASFSPESEPDFGDPAHAATRSPAVYYAKMSRGGMGSGMPNWGTILSEDELWGLTYYLFSFMFDYAPEE